MITTDRNKFLGGHVTESVKDAMRVEAQRRLISMSELQYLFLVEKLGQLGYQLPELKPPVQTEAHV